MNKEKLAVMIDGGLGRVLCAIPSLQELNQTYDLKVMCAGWLFAFRGSGLNVMPSGLPNQVESLEGYPVVKPEPYWDLGYRSGSLNMVQAFYSQLGLEIPDGNPLPYNPDTLFTNAHVSSTKPVLLLQPYGSGGKDDPRSMTQKEINEVTHKYGKTHTVAVIGYEEDIRLPEGTLHIRKCDEPQFIQYVQRADKFIGCDSAGLHIAAAAGVPHKAYLSTTSGVKYYEETISLVRKGYEDMRVNPRL